MIHWGPECIKECNCNSDQCDSTHGCLECPEGLTGVGDCVEDVDECHTMIKPCGNNATSNNTYASYNCICHEGFIWDFNDKCIGKIVYVRPF